MIIWVIIGFGIAGILFLLFTPIFLIVDSKCGEISLGLWGIGDARLVRAEGKFGIALDILGWKKVIYLGEPVKKKSDKPKRRHFTMKKQTTRETARKFKALLGSFTVRRFYLNLDTDSYPLNGLLYPLTAMLSGGNRRIAINFNGEVELQLRITNNLQRMLRAYLFT